MPIIDVAPVFLSDCDLLIAADDYAAHISSARFAPSSSTQTWQGMKKTSVHSASTAPTWVLDLTYAQDWDSAKSLSQYLLTNAGTVKEITLKPRSGGKGFKANVMIQPGPIGGDVNTHATGQVSLGCKGAPTAVPGA